MEVNIPNPSIPIPAPYAEQLGKGAAEPVPTIPIVITPPTAIDVNIARIGNFITSSETFNAGISFLSIRTASYSAVGFACTQDQTAKAFYMLGFIFAGAAAKVFLSQVENK